VLYLVSGLWTDRILGVTGLCDRFLTYPDLTTARAATATSAVECEVTAATGPGGVGVSVYSEVSSKSAIHR
jgi:hypothetical protein